MAKNLNTVSFTVLLLVLVVASTGFLKSEAIICGNAVCPTAADRVFHGECGAEPFLLTDADCCTCCKSTYDISKLCWAIVEGTDRHCHCYYKKV